MTWPLLILIPTFAALPNVDEPGRRGEGSSTELVTLCSTAEPMSGPPVLVLVVPGVLLQVGQHGVGVGHQGLHRGGDGRGVACHVTVTGVALTCWAVTDRPGSRPVTVLVWDEKV